MWERFFDDLDACQRGRVDPKPLLRGGFGQFSNFFSKIKIWISMFPNLILVSIGYVYLIYGVKPGRKLIFNFFLDIASAIPPNNAPLA